MSKYKIDDNTYSDGVHLMSFREVCKHCMERREAEDRPYMWAEERESFGAYAGRWCDDCWPKSGFRDAVDPSERFDPADAGETLEAEDDSCA